MAEVKEPRQWPKSPRELIVRLCQLQEEYAKVMGYSAPRDCFCGTAGFWRNGDNWPGSASHWENDGSAVDFIERVVRSVLEEMRRAKAVEQSLEDEE